MSQVLPPSVCPEKRGINLPPTIVDQEHDYDNFNQLIETRIGSDTVTYAYNGDGLRVKKDNTRYYYEDTKLVLEKTSSGSTWIVQGLTALAQIQSDGTIMYLMYDARGSVTAILGSGGAVLASYYYDPFGEVIDQDGTAKSTIRYAGYQFDEETENYYLIARYYDPRTARFLTQDTYLGDRYDPLSLNLYTYCHNEPIMYWDPSGHQNVYGNSIDIALAKDAAASLGLLDYYNFIDTTNGKYGSIASGSIVLGGPEAIGGVGANVNLNGSIRIFGPNRYNTQESFSDYIRTFPAGSSSGSSSGTGNNTTGNTNNNNPTTQPKPASDAGKSNPDLYIPGIPNAGSGNDAYARLNGIINTYGSYSIIDAGRTLLWNYGSGSVEFRDGLYQS